LREYRKHFIAYAGPGLAGPNLGGFMTWTEIILYFIFIVAICAFALLGVMRTETSGNRLQMTPDEVNTVMSNLKKRSAADCVLTRTDYGFVCKEMATGKSYKVRVK
jgi:hypothetical protein